MQSAAWTAAKVATVLHPIRLDTSTTYEHIPFRHICVSCSRAESKTNILIILDMPERISATTIVNEAIFQSEQA